MKLRFLVNWVLAVSLLGIATLPAPAEEMVNSTTPTEPMLENPVPPQVEPEIVNPQPVNDYQAVIPASTAIVIAFPNTVEFDAGQKQSLPVTLILAQPILDGYGNILIPENSPVSAQLVPKDGGAQILADSLIVNGQLLPIQATSTVIPGMTVMLSDANEQAQKNAPAYSHLGSSLLGAFSNGDPDSMITGGLIGHGLGILSGLFSPQTLRLVTIPENSVYILSLQSALSPDVTDLSLASP